MKYRIAERYLSYVVKTNAFFINKLIQSQIDYNVVKSFHIRWYHSNWVVD